MTGVAFVVPYAMETTLRFVRATAGLPDVRLAVISQEPPGRLPHDVRRRLAAHRVVGDAFDAERLEAAVREVAGAVGGRVERLVGVLEQLQVPMAVVREQLGIRGMDVREAENFRDKARMKEILRAHGIPCARHRLARSPAEALAFAELYLPLVAKPPAGSGARNTLRIERRDDLEGYLRTSPPTAEEPLLLEEFIQGQEHSFDSVSVGGEHVFHSISRYHPGPLEVMEKPYLQWCVVLPREIDGPEYDDVRRVGRATLDALGMVTGLTHMEWFRRADGSLAISEVAARPPGAQFTSLLSFAHDLDFYGAWARLVVHERFDPPPRNWAVGAVFLRGQGRGNVQRVHGLDEAGRELSGLVVHARLPQPGTPSSDGYEGEGHVILRHPETAVVEAGMKRLLELLRVELG